MRQSPAAAYLCCLCMIKIFTLLKRTEAFRDFSLFFTIFNSRVCLLGSLAGQYPLFMCLPFLVAGGAVCSWHLWSTSSVLVPPLCRYSVHQHPGQNYTPASPPLGQLSASTNKSNHIYLALKTDNLQAHVSKYINQEVMRYTVYTVLMQLVHLRRESKVYLCLLSSLFGVLY